MKPLSLMIMVVAILALFFMDFPTVVFTAIGKLSLNDTVDQISIAGSIIISGFAVMLIYDIETHSNSDSTTSY